MSNMCLNLIEYNKPKHYPYQATLETVNAGQPYYVGSVEFGYEGKHVPVKGTVSNYSWVDWNTGRIKTEKRLTDSLWVTCTQSRYQFNKKYCRCFLKDDGVIHQTYSDRLAFLTEEAAKYYSKTGKFLQEKTTMTRNDLKTGMMVETKEGVFGLVVGNAVVWFDDNMGGTSLSRFDQSLRHTDDISKTIYKVYAEKKDCSGSSMSFKIDNPKYYLCGELLWTRPEEPEVKEMTMSEVCKALGEQIKIIEG